MQRFAFNGKRYEIMERITTILMLGGARRVSMADLLKRAGERIGHEVKIVSYELSTDVPIALAGKVVTGKKWGDPDCVADIVDVCDRYGVDIILPFVDGAIEVAARCKEYLPEVFIPVSDAGLAARMFDKIEAATAFEEAGLPIPQTYTALTADLPAIAKPRHGSASRGIKVFHNMDDLMHLENLQDYLIQEYVEHKREYTVDCYVSQSGEILLTVPRLRIEVMGGEVTRTKTVRNEELIGMSREVLEKFAFRGPVTLQFLEDTDSGRFMLMEINPRLGGGVVCSIYAGAPFTDYLLRESLHMRVRPSDDWNDNTLMARYFAEAIF